MVSVYDVLAGAGRSERETPYGVVRELYSDDQIELVAVTKAEEEIDPGWFSQETVDLIVVLKGRLRFEFEGSGEERTLGPGELLVLPAGVRCRAYRWPRSEREPTVFIAVYPRRAR